MMAANTKDFVVKNSPIICRILICFATLFLPSNTPLYSSKGKTMTRIKSEGFIRPFFTRFESLGHFSREKSSFWTAKIHEFWGRHAFSQFRIVNQTYLRTKISFKNFLSHTLRDKSNIGKNATTGGKHKQKGSPVILFVISLESLSSETPQRPLLKLKIEH